MPLRVLFILSMDFDPEGGGVQRTTYKMSSYFSSRGIHCGVLAPGFAKDSGYSSHMETFVMDSLAKKKLYESLLSAIDSFRPDIIINQVPHEIAVTRALSQIRQIRTFVLLGCLRNSLFSVRNDLKTYTQTAFRLPGWLASFKPLQYLAWRIHFLRHRKALKEILDVHDRFILLTHANARELSLFVGDYKRQKVAIIPNSIPTIHPEESKQNILLYVGRLDITQKRSNLLLPLWKKIQEKAPDWKFHIVGEGPQLEALKYQVRTEQIENVELFGKQDPDTYYAQSGIFVMTSAFEGFPNVLIEGMSFGTVPVCFDSYGAVSEILRSGQDGILVKDLDLDMMTQSVLKIMHDKRLRRSMSESSLQSASKYVIETVYEQWIREFESQGIEVPGYIGRQD